MRLMAKVIIPLEESDEGLKRDALLQTTQAAIERLKPESAYFFEEDGKSECIFVFNLDIPSLLKPLFPNLGASFHVTPVMNASEFGLGAADKQWDKQRLGGAKGKQPLVEESAFLADIRPVTTGTPSQRSAHGDWIHPSALSEDELAKRKP